MLVCTKRTTSGRIVALRTAGTLIDWPEASPESENTFATGCDYSYVSNFYLFFLLFFINYLIKCLVKFGQTRKVIDGWMEH